MTLRLCDQFERHLNYALRFNDVTTFKVKRIMKSLLLRGMLLENDTNSRNLS